MFGFRYNKINTTQLKHVIGLMLCLCGCSKKKLCAIYGKWTECLYTVDTASFEAHKKTEKRNSEDKKKQVNRQGFASTAFKLLLSGWS